MKDIAMTVVSNMLFSAYKQYCRECWKTFYKK